MADSGEVDGLTYNNDGSFQTSNEQLGKLPKRDFSNKIDEKGIFMRFLQIFGSRIMDHN